MGKGDGALLTDLYQFSLAHWAAGPHPRAAFRPRAKCHRAMNERKGRARAGAAFRRRFRCRSLRQSAVTSTIVKPSFRAASARRSSSVTN